MKQAKIETEEEIKFLEQKLSEKAKILGIKEQMIVKKYAISNQFSFGVLRENKFLQDNRFQLYRTKAKDGINNIMFDNASLPELILLQYIYILAYNGFREISDYEFDLICQGCSKMKTQQTKLLGTNFDDKTKEDNVYQSKFTVRGKEILPCFAFGVDNVSKKMLLDIWDNNSTSVRSSSRKD